MLHAFSYNQSALFRTLKFAALLWINFVIAIVGTAAIDTGYARVFPPDSLADLIRKESLLSIICAASIGFAKCRIWPHSATNWTWALAAAWFIFGFFWLRTSGRSELFGPLFWFGSGKNIGPAEIRSFYGFTIPLIRGTSYSAGAYMSRRAPANAWPANLRF